MSILVCSISWKPFYRGEEDGFLSDFIKNNEDRTNFINFNGIYYGYFDGSQLCQEQKTHHQKIDYVIFVAKQPNMSSVIVGWYGNATLYRDEQYFDIEAPYFVSAEDHDVVLLPEKDRTFHLDIEGAYQWLSPDRRLMNYLRQTKRINYRKEDLNKSITLPLQSLQITCEFIEKEIANNDLLKALQIVNKGILTYGRLASLIYYKAWILYSFLQYRQASLLLFQIKEIPEFHDFACYMLGNIYFETGEYPTCIEMLKSVKKLNPDQTFYMIAQAYAMESDVEQAKKAISQAIMLNPEETVYQEFSEDLRAWSHE